MTWPEWLTTYGSLGRSFRELGETIDAAVTARDALKLEQAEGVLVDLGFDLSEALWDFPTEPES